VHEDTAFKLMSTGNNGDTEQPKKRASVLDVLKQERKHAKEFSKLRKQVQFW
jgi:hypothetical protein